MRTALGQYHRDCHDTEYDGAQAIGPQIATLRAQVMALFRKHGPMTDDELMDAYTAAHGSIYKNSLEPRRYELVKDGLLEKTAAKRKGKSGVSRIVWGIPNMAPVQLTLEDA